MSKNVSLVCVEQQSLLDVLFLAYCVTSRGGGEEEKNIINTTVILIIPQMTSTPLTAQ